MFFRVLPVAALVFAFQIMAQRRSSRLASPSELASFARVARELTSRGYYYSAIPWLKEYMVSTQGRLGPKVDRLLNEVIAETGTGPFEQLPIRILRYSDSGTVRYIVAKKYLNQGKLRSSLAELNKISSGNRLYPFVSHMKAAIYSLTGNQSLAIQHFNDCQQFSNKWIGRSSSKVRNRQLEMNRQYCVAGISRAYFADRKYAKSELAYLDIEKEEYIWPELLFEEAWNSYYMKNYNRSLGKLVTYKAPVFNYIFNSEIEILNALSYMRLCLYDDVRKIVDKFYALYSGPTKDLRKFLLNRGRDYQYFYQLIMNFGKRGDDSGGLLSSILRSISRDPAFQEMKESLIKASREYALIRRSRNPRLVAIMTKSILSVIYDLKASVGSYVRTRLVEEYGNLYEAFQGMSYIKLEVLSRKKTKLYASRSMRRTRGDVRYISPNEKQYFWTFNGEFWADELGDYVFALADECGGRR